MSKKKNDSIDDKEIIDLMKESVESINKIDEEILKRELKEIEK